MEATTQMEKKNLYGIVALSVIAMLGLSGLAAAYGGFGFGKTLTQEQITKMQEQRKTMQDAIANNDFATWKSLQEQRIADMQTQITQENFDAIVNQHNQMKELRNAMQEARQSGDYSKVQQLENQYNIRPEFGFGKGMHKMMRGKIAE